MTDKVEDVKYEVAGEATKTKEVKVEAEAAKIDDDAKWRAKFKMTKSEFEEFKLASEKEKSELLSKHEATLKDRQSMQDKLIDAKIEAQAVAAGIKDLEFVKLMDKSSVKIDEKGDVQGVSEAINAFKTRKPELFGTEKKFSSSSNAAVSTGTGTSSAPAGRNAWDIPKEEWKTAKLKAMKGKFS